MKTLRELEAYQYLDRAAESISLASNELPILRVLHSMLKIEAGYIYWLTKTDRENMAVVQITQNGFPELPSWYADLSAAFNEYDQIKARRVKALAPMLSNISNLDLLGFREGSAKVETQLRDEYPLSSAIGSLNKQRDFLDSFSRKNSKSPFYSLSSLPGVLVAKIVDTPFEEKVKNEKSQYPEAVSFKYVDLGCKEDLQKPWALPTVFVSNYGLKGPNFLRIINKRLKFASDYFIKRHALKAMLGGSFSYTRIYDLNSPDYGHESDENRDIFAFDKAVRSFHPSLIREFLLTDFANLSSEDSLQFILAFLEIGRMVNELKVLCFNTINGGTIDSWEFANKSQEISKVLGSSFAAIHNDELKVTTKVALKEATRQILSQAATSASVSLKALEEP